MKRKYFSHSGQSSGGLKSLTRKASLLAALGMGLSAHGQELIWQETFETDGEGSRYVTDGAGVFETDSFADNGISTDQAGPVYWTRVADGSPSLVGVPAPTPERRIVMAWGSAIVADDITDDFWTHFDAVTEWLLRGKANATVFFSGLGGEGDIALAERLESKGHTVEEDPGGDLPDPDSVDMYVYSGGATSRFVTFPVPGIHYNSGDLDDELLSSIGTALTTTLPEIKITAPEHPSAGGQEGTAIWVENDNTFQGLGTELPGGSTVVAAFIRLVTPSVLDLAAADALFDGTTPSTAVQSTSISVADIVNTVSPASQIEFFDWDNPIAGDPSGGFAVRATGQVEASGGVVSLAIGGADGSRLRIDIDGNGFDANDDIVALDRRGGWQYSAPVDVDIAAGTYDFEWVSFNAAAEFGAEFLVALDGGGGAEAVNDLAWDLVSTSSPNVTLVGDIDVETYVPDLPPEEVETPFTLALEAPEDGGAVFGGGPFGSFEGESFFAGSALNKFTGDDGVGSPKWITWSDPIDVSGKDNIKLTIATGATFLDFETGDYLKVYIDDGTDPLIWFTAPSGDDKFFNDVRTNPSNPTRLGLALQDITYDIPDDVNSISLRIEAITTWWNEIVAFDNIRITSGEIVAPPSGPVALQLANLDNAGAADSDAAIGQALTDNFGFTVIAVDDDTVAAGDYTIDDARADGVELIYIGSSVNSGSVVGQPWQELGVPIVNVEQATQDDFFSVDPLDGRANTNDQTSVTVVAPRHPLAAGLAAGDQLVTGAIQTHWGTPTASATLVAHEPGDPTHGVVYGIEAGAPLQNGSPSTARFVHLGFLGDAGFASIEPAGMALWKAGIEWALGINAPGLTDGLVALWNFDDQSFTDSVGEFDGTGQGTAAIGFVPGRPDFGHAISLDGVDQFVEITGGSSPDDLAFEGGSMSLSAWFKAGSFDKNWQAIIAKGEGTNWRVHRRGGEGGIAHAGGIGEGPAGADVSTGEWHHIVAVTDATGANFGTALYLDGELYSSNAGAAALSANGMPVMIGENPDARNRYFTGEIDEVALWDRVLSEAEVGSLFSGAPLGGAVSVPGGGGGIAGFSLDGATLSIEYSGVLKSADDVGGPYGDVAGASSPFAVDLSAGGNKFYIAE